MKRNSAFIGAILVLTAFGRMAAAQSLSVYEVGFRAQGSTTKTDLYRFQDDGSMVTQRSLPETLQGISMTTYGGKLYVAEQSGAINKYDLSGAFLAHFANVAAQAGTSPGSPTLESDSAGGIYVAFGGTLVPRTSFRLDLNGNVSQTFSHPKLQFPRGIDAAANRDVYILNSQGGNDRVFRFTSTGAYISDYAIPQAIDPSDLAIDETRNDLYISDELGRDVLKYDISSGAPVFVNSFRVPGDALDVFVEPTTGRVFGTLENLFGQDDTSLPAGGFELPQAGTSPTLYDAGSTFHIFEGIVAMAVPEPSTAALLVVGCVVALVAWCR